MLVTKHKPSFLYHGIPYSTEKEFLKAVKKFNDSTISEESTNRLLEMLMENIKLNISVTHSKLTNGELREKLGGVLGFIIREIHK